MANNVPPDPSVNSLDPDDMTVLSVPRRYDHVRRYVTINSPHADDPVPMFGHGVGAPAPGYSPPLVDFNNPPSRLIMFMAADGGFRPHERRRAAQGAMLVAEWLGNRQVNPVVHRRHPWHHQNLHRHYNKTTVGYLVFVAYCVGRGQWGSIILSQSPRISFLEGYEDGARQTANRFLRWIVHYYQHLNNNNLWMHVPLDYGEMQRFDLQGFMNEMVRRLGCGGIHSAAWMVAEIDAPRELVSDSTKGLLYQHVVMFGKISRRFDYKLGVEVRWRITEEQKAVIRNLRNTRLIN